MSLMDKAQLVIMWTVEPDAEGEWDRIFASHGEWMTGHPRQGDAALLSYTISKGPVLRDGCRHLQALAGGHGEVGRGPWSRDGGKQAGHGLDTAHRHGYSSAVVTAQLLHRVRADLIAERVGMINRLRDVLASALLN
jgi:hypothetical protein